MVVGVVIFITSAIGIVKEPVVFVGYKMSKLEAFGVAVAERVRESVKLIRQQQ